MTIAEAASRIAERVPVVVGEEDATLLAALGRPLARDVAAPIDVPSFDNSAVDGYAVRHGDLQPEGETALPIAARVAAGGVAEPCPPGEAVRIFTGAPMPAGADTVFMQEDTREADGRVLLPPGLKRGANRRKAGEDVARGAVMLAAGRRLKAQDIGLLASVGLTRIAVRARLRVAVFSTGDEVSEPGAPLPPAHVYDSNRFTLQALLARLGLAVSDLGILPDSRDAIAAALATAAAHHDLILTSGGVSTGEEDHVRAALTQRGNLHFWRLAIKPGRPVAMGQVGPAAFIGLPGNPVAAMVTFIHVARPVIDRLSGAAPVEPLGFPVRADFAWRKKADRREFLRVSLARAPDGAWLARKFGRDGAGILSSMVAADGLAVLEEPITALAPGDPVTFLPFSELL